MSNNNLFIMTIVVSEQNVFPIPNSIEHSQWICYKTHVRNMS